MIQFVITYLVLVIQPYSIRPCLTHESRYRVIYMDLVYEVSAVGAIIFF